MKMKIVDIHADGDAEEEYIDLEVLVDCNLKFYALTDSTYTASKGISNKHKHFYKLPTQEASKGERVRLRTGRKAKGPTSISGIDYLFHWEMKSAVWNDAGDAATLYELSAWTTVKT